MKQLCCEPAYVNEGEYVWVPWDREKRSALRCIVTMAAGHHARVENTAFGFSKLLHLSNLRVPHDDPRAMHGALAGPGDWMKP